MEPTRIIKPGIGVDTFELGMTREELWALTDCAINSYRISGASERSDTFISIGIMAEYVDGRAHNFMVWSRLERNNEYASIILLDEDICRFGREDLQTLIQIHELSYFEESAMLFVPRLGLEFEFRQDYGQEEVLEFVLVAAPREDGAE